MSKKKVDTSIFLLKEGVSPDESLKEEVRNKLKDFDKISEWKIVFEGKPSRLPDWAECLSIEDVSISTASAVLFIKCENLWFAACFGYGYNFLDKNKVVDDFGLRTALNALDKDKIKSSDVFSPSDHSKQKRTQTVADSSLHGHDVDGFSQILKRITGRVKEEYEELFKRISASSESLKISVPRDVGKWGKICLQIHDIYSKDECEKNFPEVFHLRPVEDKETEDRLFRRLLEEINQQNGEIYLELPDLIDFQEATNFRISVKDRRKHLFRCEKLDIKRFYEVIHQLGRKVKLEDLRKWELILLGPNEEKRKTFRLLKCLIFECGVEGDREYHFSHGRWYGINQDFSQELKKIDEFRTDKINDSELLSYQYRENENKYNQKLAKILGGVCLDGKMIQMPGHDKVELCDVLLVEGRAEDEVKNMFIHVKRKHGGSSGLSHLFQQGSVSLTLLNSGDKVFLNGVKKLKNNFNASLHAVVHYLIVGNKPNDSIPLFARISLSKTIRDIRSKGGEIRWSVIDPVRAC